MASSLAKNEARRALTQDDLDGFNQLYDSNTIFKTLNADATALLDTTGPGGVNFTEVPGLAASGPQDGANVDIFAADLGMGQIGNVPLAVTRVWSGSRTPGGTSVDFMDGNGPTDLGGYLQGEVSDLSNHPDFPMHLPYAGETIHSIDIIFNTNQVSMLGVNPLPEPGSALLLLAGCTAMIVRRQCRPPCRADRASRR